ncbi:MAG: DUF29 domain-containing protein [Thermocrinis sp.]|jgi:hypothetical protein|nr:DUF29 domain-containing protein [Thermocrinis sp.]
MELKVKSLKELYEKDFYLWLLENLKLLKNKEYELLDWEHLQEELEDMGKSLFSTVISQMARIMEHLYKWENFRYSPYMGNNWVQSINSARRELRRIFEDSPSLRKRAQEKEVLQKAWEMAVLDLIDWLEEPKSKRFIETYFKGKMPTKNDFPKECPYTFEQLMEYKPWVGST